MWWEDSKISEPGNVKVIWMNLVLPVQSKSAQEVVPDNIMKELC